MKKKKKKVGGTKSGNRLSFVRAKWKYKKYHRNLFFEKCKINEKDFLLKHRGSIIGYNECFFYARARKILTSEQLEGCIRKVKSRMKLLGKKLRKHRLTLKLYPDIPKTEKGTGVRMGKGKGSVEKWVIPVPLGKVLFSIKGINEKDGEWVSKGLKGKTLLSIGKSIL